MKKKSLFVSIFLAIVISLTAAFIGCGKQKGSANDALKRKLSAIYK